MSAWGQERPKAVLSSSGVDPYDASQILAGLKIGVAEIDVLKTIGLRDLSHVRFTPKADMATARASSIKVEATTRKPAPVFSDEPRVVTTARAIG
jgi:hypothetical protein